MHLSSEEILNDPILFKSLAFSNFFSTTTPMMHMVGAFVYCMSNHIEGVEPIPDGISETGLNSLAMSMVQPIKDKYKHSYGVDGEMDDDAIVQLFIKKYNQSKIPPVVHTVDF